MRRRKSSVMLCAAAAWMLIVHSCENGYGQLVDRAGAETVMRELMPIQARCEAAQWEPMYYCRYMTAITPDVVFELSFGTDEPAGSLTYNIGNSEGRQFVNAMRLYFLRLG